MKLIFRFSLFLAFAALMYACTSKPQKTEAELEATPNFTYDEVTPVDFPDTGIPGFKFPEDSTIINGWIKKGDNKAIYQHSWGIWAGLTSPSGQTVGGKELLVFETWMTPSEMIDSIKNQPIKRSNRANLNKANQFMHAFLKSGEKPDNSVSESVSYSPPAASFAIENKLFMATTLKGYLDKGMTDIPQFPNDAITIKPVFKVIEKSKLDANGLYAMPSWHGPIDSIAAFPQREWGTCIYVDINNKGQGNGSQDNTCSNPTPQNTYNVTDFINYTLNEEDVYYYNKEFGLNAKAGDIAILVGMHVTTKENRRWTWQTFWWAPDPTNPPTPSSKAIAAARPLKYLNGAANHYAMAVAYYMVFPEQPYTGGQSVGDTAIGFNPYLEAGFGRDVFKGSNSFVVKNGQKIMTNAGVRTNCMSCHIYAAVGPNSPSVTPYSGDAYVSLTDPIFNGNLKLDFAWSIQGNIDSTGFEEFKKTLTKK